MNKGLCIIPARGGSKRLPGKNIALLNDKPLICHTIDAANGLFKKIIVTSDSQDMLDMAKKYSNHESIEFSLRPKYLSTDNSKVLQTVEYYFDDSNQFDTMFSFNSIWLLLPTCPLRTKEDILTAKEYLTLDIDSVVSVTDYEFPPTLSLKEENGFLVEVNKQKPFQTGHTRSQDHPKLLRPNGALYASNWSSFGKNRNFFKGNVRPYYMPRERSVDIDHKIDLKYAELLLREQNESE